MFSLATLFEDSALTPHGFCLAWDPLMIALHVVSDGVIALSYYSIPATIGVLLLRRRDVAFGWMGWLFALFILACGTSHLMSIWTLWRPDYLAEGLVKGVTAITSFLTAAVLWPLLPRLVAMPSLASLLAANERLADQVRETERAVVALKRETAERKGAEAMLRQSQKMEAVGQLTGGIAHDFNNLLQVVQANLEALSCRLASDDSALRYVRRAMSGVQRGARMTSQLLAFARRQPLTPTVFDAGCRINEMADLLRSTLGGQITLALPERTGVWPVEADANQFDSALLNLAINARDAMPEGGALRVALEDTRLPEEELAADPELEPVRYVAVTVSDNGSGMAEEVRRAAFEPFFTTKPVGQGSGLGLSQVYGFIKQSRGHVILESSAGQGTTITLYLRRVEVPATIDGQAAT
ncbi:MAG: hypothetical protein J0H67_06090 [Rhodospirillales bacterium]|nr:hypothetical protein [Rhodospirillales bacterium]